jgi:hypothetical protein
MMSDPSFGNFQNSPVNALPNYNGGVLSLNLTTNLNTQVKA